MNWFKSTTKRVTLKIVLRSGLQTEILIREVIPLEARANTPFKDFIAWVDSEDPHFEFNELNYYYRVDRINLYAWYISVN